MTYSLPVYHKAGRLPPEGFCSAQEGEDPYTHAATGARLANLVYKVRKMPGDKDERRRLQQCINECEDLPPLTVLEATERFAFVASLKTPHLVTWTVARGTASPTDIGIDLLYLLTGRVHANPHAWDLLSFHDSMCELTEHTHSSHDGYTVNPSLGWTSPMWKESRRPLTASSFKEAVEKCNAREACIGFQETPQADFFQLVKEGSTFGGAQHISYSKPKGFIRMAAGHSKGGAEVMELGQHRKDVTVHSFNGGGVHNLRDLMRTCHNVTSHKIYGDAISSMMIPTGHERHYAALTGTKHPHSSWNFLPPKTYSTKSEHSTNKLGVKLVSQHVDHSVIREGGLLLVSVTVEDDETCSKVHTASSYVLVSLGCSLAGALSGGTWQACTMAGLVEGSRMMAAQALGGYGLCRVIEDMVHGCFDLRVAVVRVATEALVANVQRRYSGPALAIMVISLHAMGQLLTRVLQHGVADLKKHLTTNVLPSVKRMTASYVGGSIGASLGSTLGALFPLPLVYPFATPNPHLSPLLSSTKHWATSLLFSVTGRTLGARYTPEYIATPYLVLVFLSLL
eukprot:TRINITY_DN6002_c1_g2_i1.p1 TRINITY_DN6002_c1_g2~~TRINITY_DN6002_c1_g2_i1.p1  ORF type:complete len:568 (+),score=91.87 TRINITY_DN6002_c1_g2_i1:35-1738(+)